MKSKLFIFLLFPLFVSGQVPDTQTFSLQDVVSAVSPSENSLSECFGDAVSSYYNSTYYSVYYADWGNKNNLLMFRDYYVGGYGYLYNWFVISDERNIAPEGWHVPDDYEWETLITYAGGVDVAGGKLKEAGYIHWLTPNTGATNEFGFSATSSGNRNFMTGAYGGKIQLGFIWKNEEKSETSAGLVYLAFSLESTIIYYNYPKKMGLTIRLIKDDSTNTGTMTGNDGKVYTTVKIGEQVWMAENLAETKYRDGSIIPTVTDAATWVGLTTGAKCAYDNNESNVRR